VNRTCRAEVRSELRLINLNDYRSIQIFWRDSQCACFESFKHVISLRYSNGQPNPLLPFAETEPFGDDWYAAWLAAHPNERTILANDTASVTIGR